MRRIILTLACIVSLAGGLKAQADSKTIGLRLGGGFGGGAEMSYQQPLDRDHRVEVDLGLSSWGFGLNGVYQWVWDLSELGDGFNWYAGVGAGVGSYNFNYINDIHTPTVLSAGVLGQIGLEYKFQIPLTLSVDYRPGIYFVPTYQGTYDGLCIAARYRF